MNTYREPRLCAAYTTNRPGNGRLAKLTANTEAAIIASRHEASAERGCIRLRQQK